MYSSLMLLFSGGNSKLSAGAAVCTNYKPWQELMVHLTWNRVYAGKKGTEWREGRNELIPSFKGQDC